MDDPCPNYACSVTNACPSLRSAATSYNCVYQSGKYVCQTGSGVPVDARCRAEAPTGAAACTAFRACMDNPCPGFICNVTNNACPALHPGTNFPCRYTAAGQYVCETPSGTSAAGVCSGSATTGAAACTTFKGCMDNSCPTFLELDSLSATINYESCTHDGAGTTPGHSGDVSCN